MGTAHSPRSEIVVDLEAIQDNLRLLSDRVARGVEIMPILKADGYGHGAAAVAHAARNMGITWFGTASLSEALQLREAGITTRLFSWLDTPEVDFVPGVERDIDVSVSSLDELNRVARAAERVGKSARVHLKIDTGLGRNGCPPYAWNDLVRSAVAEPGVSVIAVWSHLARADEPGHPSVDDQVRQFSLAYAATQDVGLQPLRHVANSAATLTRPDLHFDLVRPGIAMYGLNPVPQPEGLRPAMSFHSSVALTKRIQAGEGVSYGHTWIARDETTVALVPVGYADGVPRSLSNRMDVWLAGKRRPVVGAICMDQLVVDCGDDEPALGTEVVLFGSGADVPTATEWAETIGTIDYEIVTGMYRPRVRRRYLGGNTR